MEQEPRPNPEIESWRDLHLYGIAKLERGFAVPRGGDPNSDVGWFAALPVNEDMVSWELDRLMEVEDPADPQIVSSLIYHGDEMIGLWLIRERAGKIEATPYETADELLAAFRELATSYKAKERGDGTEP